MAVHYFVVYMYHIFFIYSSVDGHLSCSHVLAWRRQCHPTPVLLPGKSHGRRSLVGSSPWGRYESYMTERLHFFLFTFVHWRRKWQPIPVFLPGESHGRRSLGGYSPWGHRVGHDRATKPPPQSVFKLC